MPGAVAREIAGEAVTPVPARAMRRLGILLAVCLSVVLGGAPAAAAVKATFYAHSGNQIRGGWLLFPPAYVTLTGTVEATGEVVDEAVGFTAKFPGPVSSNGRMPSICPRDTPICRWRSATRCSRR